MEGEDATTRLRADRPNALLWFVAVVQLAAFGGFWWWLSTASAAQGPSLASVTQIVAPVVLFAMVALGGLAVRVLVARSAMPLIRWSTGVVQIATFLFLVLLGVVTPVLLSAELVFAGIG